MHSYQKVRTSVRITLSIFSDHGQREQSFGRVSIHFRKDEAMTHLTRRQALGGVALAVASSTLPFRASAKAPLVGSQAPGYYRRKVGDAEVTALLDGYLDIGHKLWVGIKEEEVKKAAKQAGLPGDEAIRIGITSYLINTGDRLVLVDSGSADLFGPTAGHFLKTFAATGHTPDQVDVILITHMHPDHIASLVTGTKPNFPNAELHICSLDFDYWTSDTSKAQAPDNAKSWFTASQNVAKAYDGRIKLFTGGPEVTPGIVAVPLVGHTPGHTGYRLRSAGEELLLWGDACGVAAVQFAHPEAGLIFDVDGATGKKTRARLLDMAANEQVLVASAHLPFPSFGRVERRGNAYNWVPDEYRYAM